MLPSLETVESASVRRGWGWALTRREFQGATRVATEASLGRIPVDDIAARRRVMAAARGDLFAHQRAACEQIDAETRRVLHLDERTAAIAVAELWGRLLEQN